MNTLVDCFTSNVTLFFELSQLLAEVDRTNQRRKCDETSVTGLYQYTRLALSKQMQRVNKPTKAMRADAGFCKYRLPTYQA
jgi:hypothetical protein